METVEQILSSLKLKRAPLKAQITRQAKCISTYIITDEVSHQELISRKRKLEEIFQKFENIQLEITQLDLSDAELDYSETVENSVLKALSVAESLLKSHNDSLLQAVAQEEVQARQVAVQEEAQAKLTKLNCIKAQLDVYIQIIYDSIIDDELSYQEFLVLRGEFQNTVDEYKNLRSHFQEVEGFQNVETNCRKALAYCNSSLNKHKEIYQPEQSSTIQRLSLDAPTTTLPKLPEIRLPRFSGDPTAWIEFRDIFTSLIINNQHISDMDKFQYLKSCLTVEVMSVIRNIPVSAATFEVAWRTLSERFDNNRLIANTHIEHLFSPPNLESDSSESLQRYLDHFISTVHALQSLNTDVSLTDLIISKIILDRLQPTIIKDWESSVKQDQLPTLKDLFDFLESKVRILQMTDAAVKSQSNNSSPIKTNMKVNSTSTHYDNRNKPIIRSRCICCKQSTFHELFMCDAFKSMNVARREQFVKFNKLCRICLRAGGHSSSCNTFKCAICNLGHSTYLHNSNLQSANTAGMIASHNTQQSCLLPTATVLINDCNGLPVEAIALLDTGSDCNLISSRLSNRLQLSPLSQRTTLTGIISSQVSTHKVVPLSIHSNTTTWHYNAHAIIVPEITTTKLPRTSIDIQTWDIPPNLNLADSNFYIPKFVDLLLGVEICSQIVCAGKITANQLPVIQNSHLGWYVSGKLPQPNLNNQTQSSTRLHSSLKSSTTSNNACATHETSSHYSAFLSADQSVSDQLTKFWDLEKVSNHVPFSDESHCEQHFVESTTRDSNGRYIVKLPFTTEPQSLGSTKAQAYKRFASLEKRLANSESLANDYVNFMSEYESLGHMEPADLNSVQSFDYIIPHHPVLKPSSSTTKLRVVFDASAKSSNDKSLNDILAIGPTVQPDLFSILLRFRLNPIAFTADIAKMYRQVMVHPEHQPFQQILWRNTPTETIKIFNLKTVTYGTASASFLATRALKQLTIDEGTPFPLASFILNNATYVDDIVATAPNVSQAKTMIAELNSLLPLGGFEPRKWSSNTPELLENIPLELQETHDFRTFGDSDATSVKALGLIWQPSSDVLRIETSIDFSKPFTTCSRRTLLSCIASIFDPLGLISPIVAYCKIIFQSLWKETTSWDQPIPQSVAKRWLKVHEQLNLISQITIPRLALSQNLNSVQLHGFCDASEVAYGSCLYLRSIDQCGNVTVSLLCAKSRIAPIKAITIPRLELLAAHLLANLIHKVLPTLQLNISLVYLWSDSNVVLSWLHRSPVTLKTFVANRVADIQEYTANHSWRHVTSRDNPADLISRGATPQDLVQNQLWWMGPSWLSKDNSQWPGNNPLIMSDPLPEIKVVAHIQSQVCTFNAWLTKFPYLKTLRIMAYILRFLNNCRQPQNQLKGPLTANEISLSLQHCIKGVQQQAYSEEFQILASGNEISNSSKLHNLCPFLDSVGILRVGGRLERSELPFDAKHQILLPSNHPFTKHLIRYTHFQMCHAGPQLIIAHLRERFWVPSIRKIIRSVLRQCNTCFRFKAQPLQQKMADLPSTRVTPISPFTNVSIDYAGPYLIKYGGPRSKITTKAYLAIFVCMSTKAVHLELVTTLTSRAFLAALSRFTGRRGIPSSITSDNGTNFVGAQADLQHLAELLSSDAHQSFIQDATTPFNISWHFLPPHSPHMGGLHEAAVRSTKYHLKRMSTSLTFTYEEMSTLLIQIEAILNSRPLISLHEEVDDFHYLSPGHFLIGKALVSLPPPDLTGGYSLRSRWSALHQFIVNLWKRWSTDYLHTLQKRSKWTRVSSNLTIGSPVLLIEDNTPPLKWILGVIDQIHPGPDGLVRVATVRTPTGLYKRPIVKIAPLPIEEE